MSSLGINWLSEENSVLAEKLTKVLNTLQRVRDENISLRASARRNSRDLTLEAKLLECFEQNIKKVKPSIHTPSPYKEVARDWGNVVGISDWHIGEEVDAEQMNGINSFNYSIAEKRVKRYIKEIKSSNISRSKNLTICDLGDNIRGIIHNGLNDTEGGLMVSLVKCVDIIMMFIKSMLDIYDKVNYYFVVGNHSRLDDMIQSKDKYQDYSWLIIQMVIRLFSEEDRVKFHISKSGYHLIHINSARIFAFHGDTMRGYAPSSTSSRMKVQDMCMTLTGKQAQIFFSGHTHNAMSIMNQYKGWCIVSGCLVGSNEYGLQSGFSPIGVSQVMFDVNYKGTIKDIKHFDLGVCDDEV